MQLNLFFPLNLLNVGVEASGRSWGGGGEHIYIYICIFWDFRTTWGLHAWLEPAYPTATLPKEVLANPDRNLLKSKSSASLSCSGSSQRSSINYGVFFL